MSQAQLPPKPATNNQLPSAAGMGEIYVYGAPGLPNGVLDSPASGAFYNAFSPNGKEESLKRSFSAFTTSDDASSSHVSTDNGFLFNPQVHLVYQAPKNVYTMEDLALPANNGVSPVAVSEPFPLFSPEAVDRMRAEVLSDVVMGQYSYSSDIAPKQLRGYAPK